MAVVLAASLLLSAATVGALASSGAAGAVGLASVNQPVETPEEPDTPEETPPTEAPPTEAPPTETPPTEAPPTETPPTETPEDGDIDYVTDGLSFAGTNTGTFDIVVTDVDDGVGAGEFRVVVDRPDSVKLVDIDLAEASLEDVEVAQDGSFIDVEYFGGQDDSSGDFVVATVTVESQGIGGAVTISVEPSEGNSEVLFFDVDGSPIEIDDVPDLQFVAPS